MHLFAEFNHQQAGTPISWSGDRGFSVAELEEKGAWDVSFFVFVRDELHLIQTTLVPCQSGGGL